MFGSRGIELKTPEQLWAMKRSGAIVAEALAEARAAVRPGVTPRELDALCERIIRERGGAPNFLGYHGFPATICASVNEVVVHGIPGDDPLVEGDVISIDCGAILDGWHSDSAITVPVGEVTSEVAELLRVTEESMWRGIAAIRQGGKIGDIGHAIEAYVGGEGTYGVVEEYVGHGIGTALHQPPNVPNFGRPGHGPKIVRGMALAIEPMLTLGTIENRTLADDWTVVTADGSWAAHFEHSVGVFADGLVVLTAPDGGKAELERLGAAYAGD